MKEGEGRKLEVKKNKRKRGKKTSFLTRCFIPIPDFTEDDTLMGGYVTGPGSLNQLFAEVGLKCKASVC